MTTLYLPPHVAIQRQREHHAGIMARATINDPRARELTTVLQNIDDGLFVVRAHPMFEAHAGMIPGCYHVLVMRPGVPTNAIPLHANGAYVEPTIERVTEVLLAGNMGDRRVRESVAARDAAVDTAAERELARQRSERREELKDRVNAATRAQISMDDTLPWTQNSAGRRPKLVMP